VSFAPVLLLSRVGGGDGAGGGAGNDDGILDGDIGGVSWRFIPLPLGRGAVGEFYRMEAYRPVEGR